MESIMSEGPNPPNETTARPLHGAPERPARVGPKRLYRHPKGPVAGIASGMAGYFDVDPVLVRLLWLVALFSGIGFFAYVVFWVIVPKAPSWPPPGYDDGSALSTGGRDDISPVVSGLLMIAVAAVLGSHLGGLGDLVLPAVLVGFGVYLLNQRGGPATFEGHVPAEPHGAEPGTVSSPSVGAAEPVTHGPAAPTATITPVVLSLLALAAGIGWALHSAGVIRLSVAAAAAAGLVVVGAGLIGSLWVGRARGLVPLGIGLGFLLVVASAVEPRLEETPALTLHRDSNPSHAGTGTHTYRPISLAELEDEYQLGVGQLFLDLRDVDLEGTTQHVDVEVGMGQATVIVPPDVSLDVTGEVGIGKAVALDVRSEGIGREVEASELVDAAGKLIIHFEVGVGEGTVRREL